MEKILKIEEGSFGRDKWSSYDGFIITTDEQTIKIGISNDQQCCEQWGYFMSQDSLSDFIGAELFDITVTDIELNSEKADKEKSEYAACMFINFSTSEGLLQFTAYNDHNGYYSHDAVIISETLNYQESL